MPKRNKSNAVFGELHREKRISTVFNPEVKYIVGKFTKGDYPLRLINNVVNALIRSTNDLEDSYISSIQLGCIRTFWSIRSFWLKNHA